MAAITKLRPEELADNFQVKFSELMRVNQDLQTEFLAGDRYKAAAALNAQSAK